ncbi:hypothetical protein ACFLXI_08570 [Chloroflexota bacterium]
MLKYAIQRLQSIDIEQSNWELAQQLHFQFLMVETGTFLPVLGRLIHRHQNGFAIDFQTISELINSQLLLQCPLDHVSEVSWALWAALYWSIPIDPSAATRLSRVNDSIVALLALDAKRRGLIPNGLSTTSWERFMTQDELYGDQWLLSYEANIKGWLPSVGGGDHVGADPNFGFLKNQDVAFYEIQKVMSTPTGASASQGLYPIFTFPSKSVLP